MNFSTFLFPALSAVLVNLLLKICLLFYFLENYYYGKQSTFKVHRSEGSGLENLPGNAHGTFVLNIMARESSLLTGLIFLVRELHLPALAWKMGKLIHGGWLILVKIIRFSPSSVELLKCIKI